MNTVNFKRLAILFALVFSVSFISCNKDDDDEGINNDLIGSWKMENVEGWSESGISKIIITMDVIGEGIVIFKADGKYSQSEFFDETTGTWVFENEKLTMTDSDETAVYDVLTLTSTELILERTVGTTLYVKKTYKKQ